MYGQGPTLRQIGAELGTHWSTVSQQLERAGVTMRRGAPSHPASTQQILELRDQGVAWTEVAEQVDMTVSGAWSRYRRARPPDQPRLAVGSRCSPRTDQNLAIGPGRGSRTVRLSTDHGATVRYVLLPVVHRTMALLSALLSIGWCPCTGLTAA